MFTQSWRIELIDKFTQRFAKIGAQLQRGNSWLKRHAKQWQNIGLKSMFAGEMATRFGKEMMSSLSGPVREAIAFETAMADVKKVVDFETPQQFKEMGDDIRKLSTRVPLAAKELATITAAAGQAGVARHELLRFSEDAAKMATAFDMGAGQAGAAMTGLRSIFALNQDGVVALGDSYNYLSNSLDAKAADLVNIANRAGSTAKLIGLSGQELGALGATFLALKTPPEVAATGINAFLTKLATADKQGPRFQDGLAKIGLNAISLKTALDEDAQPALLGFLQSVKKSDDVIGTLSDLFGAEYADDIAKLVGRLDIYESASKLAGDQTGYAGSMLHEYQMRADTTENALIILDNKFANLKVTIGNALLPALKTLTKIIGPLAESFTQFAKENPELTKWLVLIAVGFAAVAVVGGVFLSLFGLFATGLAIAAAGLGTAAGAVWAFNIALLASPITWLIAALFMLFGALYMLWYHWDTITQWLQKAWQGLINWLVSGIGGLGHKITSVLAQSFDDVKQWLFGFSLFQAGSNILESLVDGIKSTASEPIKLIENIVGQVRDFLPFSPAKKGPLRDLDKIRLIETIADTIQAKPLLQAMRSTATAAMAALASPALAASPVLSAPALLSIPTLSAPAKPPQAASLFARPITSLDRTAAPAITQTQTHPDAGTQSATTITAPPPTINIAYNINGGNAEDVIGKLRAHETELATLIEQALARQQRKRF